MVVTAEKIQNLQNAKISPIHVSESDHKNAMSWEATKPSKKIFSFRIASMSIFNVINQHFRLKVNIFTRIEQIGVALALYTCVREMFL